MTRQNTQCVNCEGITPWNEARCIHCGFSPFNKVTEPEPEPDSFVVPEPVVSIEPEPEQEPKSTPVDYLAIFLNMEPQVISEQVLNAAEAAKLEAILGVINL